MPKRNNFRLDQITLVQFEPQLFHVGVHFQLTSVSQFRKALRGHAARLGLDLKTWETYNGAIAAIAIPKDSKEVATFGPGPYDLLQVENTAKLWNEALSATWLEFFEGSDYTADNLDAFKRRVSGMAKGRGLKIVTWETIRNSLVVYVARGLYH